MYLIGSIGFSFQSAVTLYIYRVGKTYPARNHVYRSKSIKNSNCTRTPHGPVRPTGQTGRAPARSATAPDWSYRLVGLVRPVDVNFGCQHGHHLESYADIFSKVCKFIELPFYTTY